MITFLSQGGFLMIPIGICSVLAVAFTSERAWYLWQSHVPVETFWDNIGPELDSGNFEEVRDRLDEYDSGLLVELVQRGIDTSRESVERAEEEMEEFGLERVPELDRFLPALNFIAQVSPLLGLLGTVVGMIETFSVIAEAGVGQPELLAGGISKALITTASGLAVGIITLFFHHLVSRRVDQITHEMELSVRRVTEALNNSSNGESN